jgi:hypothetical protein
MGPPSSLSPITAAENKPVVKNVPVLTECWPIRWENLAIVKLSPSSNLSTTHTKATSADDVSTPTAGAFIRYVSATLLVGVPADAIPTAPGKFGIRRGKPVRVFKAISFAESAGFFVAASLADPLPLLQVYGQALSCPRTLAI